MTKLINFCVFKWKDEGKKLLPSQTNVDYDEIAANHVNIMYHMVKRNLHVPHRFICITDDPEGLDENIDIVPLWDDCKELGGCYKRLKFFSKKMKKLIGDRIVQCDIDTVITGDITPLINRPEPLILYRHHQHKVNGGLWIMDAGYRSDIWDFFDPKESPLRSSHEIGTDQGWLKYYLKSDLKHNKIKTISRPEGIYDMRTDILTKDGKLPNGCRMVVFPGGRDPSQFTHLDWVKEHWR